MGNLFSLEKALLRIGFNTIISNNENDILNADKLILPGVGHFSMGMENIDKLNIEKILLKKIKIDKIPVLDICLGMQLLLKYS
tara:strand:+ start:938 stop:1186 length:249 start_codon:yes stop_codon:yes gene_type:complete